jgi:hypothetical protein
VLGPRRCAAACYEALRVLELGCQQQVMCCAPQEDEQLRRLVAVCGPAKWSVVAEKIKVGQ